MCWVKRDSYLPQGFQNLKAVDSSSLYGHMLRFRRYCYLLFIRQVCASIYI